MFAEKCRAGCIASLPNAEIKDRVWSEITEINSEDSLIVLNAKMIEFYSLEQLDLVKPYFAKFFDTLLTMKDCKHFSSFFNHLLPILDAESSDIKRLQSIMK